MLSNQVVSQSSKNVLPTKNFEADECTEGCVNTSSLVPGQVGQCTSGYKTRLIYNAKVNPRDVEASLANKVEKKTDLWLIEK